MFKNICRKQTWDPNNDTVPQLANKKICIDNPNIDKINYGMLVLVIYDLEEPFQVSSIEEPVRRYIYEWNPEDPCDHQNDLIKKRKRKSFIFPYPEEMKIETQYEASKSTQNKPTLNKNNSASKTQKGIIKFPSNLKCFPHHLLSSPIQFTQKMKYLDAKKKKKNS